MRVFDDNEKGFSLVELIMALALVGIVLAVIGPFFVSNLKTFNRESDQIEAQEQAQRAINTFVEQVIGTKGILEITNPSTYEFASNDPHDPNVVFTYDSAEKKLYYGDTGNPFINTFTNITEFKLDPIGGSYDKCQGVNIKLTSKINEVEVKVENEVYFRNWEPPTP